MGGPTASVGGRLLISPIAIEPCAAVGRVESAVAIAGGPFPDEVQRVAVDNSFRDPSCTKAEAVLAGYAVAAAAQGDDDRARLIRVGELCELPDETAIE